MRTYRDSGDLVGGVTGRQPPPGQTPRGETSLPGRHPLADTPSIPTLHPLYTILLFYTTHLPTLGRMTHACGNITFPYTSYVVGNNHYNRWHFCEIKVRKN